MKALSLQLHIVNDFVFQLHRYVVECKAKRNCDKLLFVKNSSNAWFLNSKPLSRRIFWTGFRNCSSTCLMKSMSFWVASNFFLRKKYPSKTWKIINNNQNIFVTSNAFNNRWTKKINMHQFKWFNDLWYLL